MPNIVYLWDFETGDTQGWSLGSNTVLDGGSQIQGTYSLGFTPPETKSITYTTIASISDVDLTNVSKPILIFMVKLVFTRSTYPPYWKNGSIIVRINGSIDIRTRLLVGDAFSKSGTNTITTLVAVDLSQWAGQTITIELIEYHENAIWDSAKIYVDNIALLDGADFEYNTGIVAFDNEDKSIELTVPDSDLSTLADIDRYAIALATPDWKYSTMEAIAYTDRDSLSITTSGKYNKNVNYTTIGVAGEYYQSFSKLKLRVFVNLSGAYDGFSEKFVVVFLNASLQYRRVYMFNVYYTFNGFAQRFASAVVTTTYGSTASGSRTITGKVYGNKFGMALKVKYLVGDPSVVTSGSIRLEIYSSDMGTKYGEVSVDLTVASEQISTFVENLPCDTDLTFVISWSITANARIVLLIIPLVKVS